VEWDQKIINECCIGKTGLCKSRTRCLEMFKDHSFYGLQKTNTLITAAGFFHSRFEQGALRMQMVFQLRYMPLIVIMGPEGLGLAEICYFGCVTEENQAKHKSE
jgi:hypothetical protein